LLLGFFKVKENNTNEEVEEEEGPNQNKEYEEVC
jgi:hypothetical protein